ncbi:hypothetical protein K493DRAFT_314799 [Basidiobolus meristosporus CBS 931.73]|uniref:Uncharacterized protein n=1 Tax=Basidiobolus meristosporus CBS 931.73 TaxID=1314790 RepID=A0A1Y1YCZ4_9FUNG|nr:hypothetical protein K493DRAFT_314799 [Basidiobolus meristosporus CBS 931.73]|eukprot:ORX95857.1 hypothetical protein K493DRAFT_314799 [Basidiobolus meristosporus CBS 931.73]
MFSIQNLLDSEAHSTTTRIPLATSTSTSTAAPSPESGQAAARHKVLERANTMKYLRMLKTRLTYATFKVKYGWEDRSFEEVQQLYQRTTNPALAEPSRDLPPAPKQVTEFVVPKTPVSAGHKRKPSGEVKPSRPLTPRPTFNSSTNIQYSKGQVGSNLGCKLNRKALKGSLVKFSPKSTREEVEKENFNPFGRSIPGDAFGTNPFEFITPPRPLLPRNPAVLDAQYIPLKPDFSPSVAPGFDKVSESLANPSPLRSRSTSPAFEAAETIMMLSSPRPNTPVTPRYSPLENSPPPGPPLTSSLEIHSVQSPCQDEDIFKTPKDSLNLLVTTASYFPK